MDAGLLYGCLVPHPPILVPAIGGSRSDRVRETGEAVRHIARDLLDLSLDTLVVISPHAPLNPFSMGILPAQRYEGGFEAFGVEGARLSRECDQALGEQLARECNARSIPAGRVSRGHGAHHLDHGALVPLYLFAEVGVKTQVLLLSFSSAQVDTHRRFGEAIASAAERSGRRIGLVASGDLSHRLFPGAPAGYSPRGRQFDEAIVSALRAHDREAVYRMDESLVEAAGECGYRSLAIALAAMPEASVEVLSYEGPFGVGYAVARFVPPPPTAADVGSRAGAKKGVAARETEVLELARMAVEGYVRGGVVIAPPRGVDGLLAERAGVFVCLKIGGELRGCIGTLQPCEPNVASEVIRNAIAAATRDPRFPPVAVEELPRLRYSVDLLSAPEPVEDEGCLDAKRYGVIVRSGYRRGLLLPDLEGVATVKRQLDIARRKAGIGSGEKVEIERFTVRRIPGEH